MNIPLAFTLDTNGYNGGERATFDRAADRLRDNANTRYETIRAKQGLTADAKHALLAEAYLQAKDEMDSLQSQTGQATATDVTALTRQVFGVDDLTASARPSEAATIAISFRDAQARVADIASPLEAHALFDNAERTGDELMARALGNACLDGGVLGIADLADRYLASRPDKAKAYVDLQQTQQPLDINSLWEFVLPTPVELSSMPAMRIEALAASAQLYG